MSVYNCLSLECGTTCHTESDGGVKLKCQWEHEEQIGLTRAS